MFALFGFARAEGAARPAPALRAPGLALTPRAAPAPLRHTPPPTPRHGRQASEARIQLAAQALADPQLRIVIALGHRAATELTAAEARGGNGGARGGGGVPSAGANPFLRLAETLNAPIVTQLDAKGCVDEGHPLAYGVLGVFGNPGLDAARALVTSADMVLLFGVDRQARRASARARVLARPAARARAAGCLLPPCAALRVSSRLCRPRSFSAALETDTRPNTRKPPQTQQ